MFPGILATSEWLSVVVITQGGAARGFCHPTAVCRVGLGGELSAARSASVDLFVAHSIFTTRGDRGNASL
jgi:hypothetical protein